MDQIAFSGVLLLLYLIIPRDGHTTMVTEQSFQPLLVSALSPIANTLPAESLLECLAMCRARSTCALAEFVQEPPTCQELDMGTHKRINPTKTAFWATNTGAKKRYIFFKK